MIASEMMRMTGSYMMEVVMQRDMRNTVGYAWHGGWTMLNQD
jgi:hypothetical protein